MRPELVLIAVLFPGTRPGATRWGTGINGGQLIEESMSAPILPGKVANETGTAVAGIIAVGSLVLEF